MKDFKFLRDNKPQLWGYIPFPFECHYKFFDRDDLWNANDITNTLDDRMVLDILNNLQEEGILQLDINVELVTVTGYHSDGTDCIEIFVKNDDGATFEEFLEL